MCHTVRRLRVAELERRLEKEKQTATALLDQVIPATGACSPQVTLLESIEISSTPDDRVELKFVKDSASMLLWLHSVTTVWTVCCPQCLTCPSLSPLPYICTHQEREDHRREMGELMTEVQALVKVQVHVYIYTPPPPSTYYAEALKLFFLYTYVCITGISLFMLHSHVQKVSLKFPTPASHVSLRSRPESSGGGVPANPGTGTRWYNSFCIHR